MKFSKGFMLFIILAAVPATSSYGMQGTNEPVTKKQKTESVFTDLQAAILSFDNNEEHVRRLLYNGADANACNMHGDTPLHWAAAENYLNIVQMLLNAGANVNTKNVHGNTALHDAVIHKHTKIVIMLLNANADINAQNNLGNTALHSACMFDELEIAKILLRHGANTSIVNQNNETPLGVAMHNGNTKIANLVSHFTKLIATATETDTIFLQ